MSRQDVAWQKDAAVRFFLDSVRGAIPFAAEQIAVMLRLVEQARGPIARVLDVGGGDGLLTAVMLDRYPDAEAVLVDFSAPMLDAARERFAGLPSPPVLIAADLATPDWLELVGRSAPFEAIVSGFAIHHLENERKRALYGELLALLAPGGVFAHIEHVAAEAPWIGHAFDGALIDAIWEHGRRANAGITRDEVALAYANRPDREANRLVLLDVQRDWLREAGFVGVVAPFRWYEIAVFGGYRLG